MGTFEFTPLTAADLPQIELWLNRPHVREAFGDALEWLTEISANRSASWVRHSRADLCGAPAGFVQVYDTLRAPEGPWSTQPPGTFGIDFFLGETEVLGRALGTRLLSEFSAFAADRVSARRLVLDPDPQNLRSIRAAQRAGFVHDAASRPWVLEIA